MTKGVLTIAADKTIFEAAERLIAGIRASFTHSLSCIRTTLKEIGHGSR